MTSATLAGQIAEMPFLDHHCHAPLKLPQQLPPEILRATFSETTDRSVQRVDVPQTVAYRAMIRWLAALLGTAPNEEAVLAARAALDPADYQRRLADDARLGPLFDDFLLQPEECYSPEEWSQLTGRPVRTLLRIEVVAQQLIPQAGSWEELRRQFHQALSESVGRGGVGFKSIAAYRCGLAIEPVDAAQASAALAEVQAELSAGAPNRLVNKTLIDALVWETLEVAAQLGVPLQFHVGLGDDDVYLPTSNPTLMRSLFQEPRYRHVPIVLLHCYPYVEEAAYLASIYPNAYVDLGLTVPLAGSDCTAQIATAFGLAPTNKLLASSDGHAVPEFQWFAAHLWRRALSRVLAEVVESDLLTVEQAIESAGLILHGNAERIYPGQGEQ